jgi:hypothetical protein
VPKQQRFMPENIPFYLKFTITTHPLQIQVPTSAGSAGTPSHEVPASAFNQYPSHHQFKVRKSDIETYQ